MAFKFNPFTGNLDLTDTTAAAGSDTQVQYNDGGSLAGSADLTWDDTGKELSVIGQVRASTGILFGSDTAAANALDDYEEGTWTPEIADASTGGNTGTSGANNSWYRKVGSLVLVSTELDDIDTTGLTGGNTFWIRNLPFSSPSGRLFAGFGQAAPLLNQTDLGRPFLNAATATTAYRISYTTTSGPKSALVSDITSGTTDIFLTLMYHV